MNWYCYLCAVVGADGERSNNNRLLLAGTGLALPAASLAETINRLDFSAAARQLEELTPLLQEYISGRST